MQTPFINGLRSTAYMTKSEASQKGYSLDELAFSVVLGKNLSEYTTNPPHVKAAKMLQEQGVEIKKGDVIRYVMTKKGAKPLQLARLKDIDREKYAGYLKSMLEQILDAFDFDYDEIIGAPRQVTLGKWFKENGIHG